MGYRGVEEQESMLEKLIQRFLEESGPRLVIMGVTRSWV